MAFNRGINLCALQGYRRYNTLCKICNPFSLDHYSYSLVNKTSKRLLFWERDRKGGYNTKETVSTIQQIKDGFKEIKSEFKLLAEEVKEYVATDPLLIARPEIICRTFPNKQFTDLAKFLALQNKNEGNEEITDANQV